MALRLGPKLSWTGACDGVCPACVRRGGKEHLPGDSFHFGDGLAEGARVVHRLGEGSVLVGTQGDGDGLLPDLARPLIAAAGRSEGASIQYRALADIARARQTPAQVPVAAGEGGGGGGGFHAA